MIIPGAIADNNLVNDIFNVAAVLADHTDINHSITDKFLDQTV